MKKYSVKLMGLALFFATSAITGMELEINNSIGVWVHNTTKYNVLVKIMPTMSASIGKSKTQIKIAPYGSEDLGRLKDLQDLKISGDYAYSEISNEAILNQIKSQASKKKNEDVYLNIIWSSANGYHIQSWHWAPSTHAKSVKYFDEWPVEKSKPTEEDWRTKSVIFSSEQFEKASATITLQDVIMNDVLGQEYAKKAMEICDANYARAKASGASDLCLDLKKMFAARAKTKEDAMRIIDSIYARLKMYKTPQGPHRIVYVE